MEQSASKNTLDFLPRLNIKKNMAVCTFIYVEILHISNTCKKKTLTIMDVLFCYYKYFITYVT